MMFSSSLLDSSSEFQDFFFDPRNTPSTDRRCALFIFASIIIINIKSAPPSPPLFYLI